MIYLRLFQLCLIIVCIVDLSGVTGSIRALLGKWLKADPTHIRIKPLDCSKCMTFWCGSIYALCVGQLTMGILLYILALALLTTAFASLGSVLLMKIENTISKWLN